MLRRPLDTHLDSLLRPETKIINVFANVYASMHKAVLGTDTGSWKLFKPCRRFGEASGKRLRSACRIILPDTMRRKGICISRRAKKIG